MNTLQKINIFAIVIFLFVNLVPFILSDRFSIYVASRSLLWAVVALQWGILLGHAGIYSFGNLFFFGVGGYVAGIAAMHGYNPILCLMAGSLLAMFSGLGIGRLTLKLKGIYMAIFTFLIQEATRHIVQLEQLSPWTGGPIGLQNIPKIRIVGIEEIYTQYLMMLTLFLVTVPVSYIVVRGKYGLLFRALRDSEDFASILGVNIYSIRLLVFSLSALFTGLAGAMFALASGGFTDEMLSISLSIDVLFMLIVGGMSTFYGPLAGAFLMTFITENFRAYLIGELAVLRVVIISITIPVILRFFNRGLVGQLEFYLTERERAKKFKLTTP
jgi:branched-chain amino acid transport system permease protein